jgi:hypothetical protein
MRLTAASGIRAPRPRTGTCRAGSRSGTATAKHPLFAAPAGLTRTRLAALAARGRPPRVTELAEYLAQPVVDIFEYGGPLGEVNAINRGEPVDGRVNTEVTGGGESWPNPFCIHRVFPLLRYPRNPDRPSSALPSRVNGTAQQGARRT